MSPEFTFIELQNELALLHDNANIEVIDVRVKDHEIILCSNGFTIILKSDGTYSSGPDGEG